MVDHKCDVTHLVALNDLLWHLWLYVWHYRYKFHHTQSQEMLSGGLFLSVIKQI